MHLVQWVQSVDSEGGFAGARYAAEDSYTLIQTLAPRYSSLFVIGWVSNVSGIFFAAVVLPIVHSA